MPEPSPSRRTVLRAGAALGVGALAGCFGDGPSDGGPSPVDAVPSGAKFVIHADVEALLNDQQLRTRLNEFLAIGAERMGVGVPDVETALDEVETATGLDPRELRTATLFGGYAPTAPSGVAFEAGWSESALRDAIGSGGDASPETHNGRTVYRLGEELALGVLEDGSYVAGTPAGVEGTIDVVAGEAAPVSGRVRDAFAAAPAGPFRFGFEPPADLGEGDAGAGPIDPVTFAPITHGYGAYVVDGDDRSGSVTLETDAAEAASDIAAALRSARDLARQQLESGTAEPEVAAELASLLSSIEVSAEGSTVRIVVGEGELLPVLLAAVLSSFLLGLGSSVEPTPQVAFDFDFDAATGELTVTHTGGDSVPASQLAVRGENVGATGGWADLGGSASGSVDGEPAVVAGDSLTVAAEPDYVARIVWESGDGTTAAELAIDRGPEA